MKKHYNLSVYFLFACLWNPLCAGELVLCGEELPSRGRLAQSALCFRGVAESKVRPPGMRFFGTNFYNVPPGHTGVSPAIVKGNSFFRVRPICLRAQGKCLNINGIPVSDIPFVESFEQLCVPGDYKLKKGDMLRLRTRRGWSLGMWDGCGLYPKIDVCRLACENDCKVFLEYSVLLRLSDDGKWEVDLFSPLVEVFRVVTVPLEDEAAVEAYGEHTACPCYFPGDKQHYLVLEYACVDFNGEIFFGTPGVLGFAEPTLRIIREKDDSTLSESLSGFEKFVCDLSQLTSEPDRVHCRHMFIPTFVMQRDFVRMSLAAASAYALLIVRGKENGSEVHYPILLSLPRDCFCRFATESEPTPGFQRAVSEANWYAYLRNSGDARGFSGEC